MEGAPVTAATGALDPVVAKLSALLGSECNLRGRTRSDIKVIKSKLKSIHSLLWTIWEREDLDTACKEFRMEAWDLADDMDDSIDDFVLSLQSQKDIKRRTVQPKTKKRLFRDLKKRADVVWKRCRKKWKLETAQTICSLFSRQQATVSCPVKPRAHPFVRKDASELMHLDGPRDKLISYLVGKEESTPGQLQLKMASIVGMAGMGKTTLADLLYVAIEKKFQSRAFVSVTPSPNMKQVLASILQQVAADGTAPFAGTEAATEEDLIGNISNLLKDRRYLVIIDDIWHYREWEIIRKSLPENNLGSRIVTTTRIIALAEKWREDSDALLHKMHPKWYAFGGWMYDISSQMIARNPDIGQGFDSDHPIVRMCGGMPLALVCMFSALAKEREHPELQGLCVSTRDVQDRIEETIKRNGIQNTPGFEPLVQSLWFDYDDLPHQMLKTCLLYCSIYPMDHLFKRDDLVRRWIAERFVYKEEEAKGYFEELVNRGLILPVTTVIPVAETEMYSIMHPTMRSFLRWKSREDNFFACSSDIASSHTCRIRRLCIDHGVDVAVEELDPLSGLDWSRIRSLVVYGDAEIVPFQKLERLRVLDLQRKRGDLQLELDHHLKDICDGLLRLRHLLGLEGSGLSEIPSEISRLQRLETLEMRETGIKRLPGEIGNLQQLKTLVASSCDHLEELPREIGNLQHLRTLDMRYSSRLANLPKEIGKLQHLEQLILRDTSVKRIPKEIRGLKELKTLKLDKGVVTLPLEVCQASELVQLPECIQQALQKSDLVSSLAGELLSFSKGTTFDERMKESEGGLVVGAKHMHIPRWIRDHFNDLALLDIRTCKLEEEDLQILREMPRLQYLTLRFEVVPREPIAIGSEGFARLKSLTIDSRVPRVTFEEGAMPMLETLRFEFQFYGGTPNKEPVHVGINHLQSLCRVRFECNKDWYRADSPCISAMIDAVTKEAQRHHKQLWMSVPRRDTCSSSSSGTGEIKEVQINRSS